MQPVQTDRAQKKNTDAHTFSCIVLWIQACIHESRFILNFVTLQFCLCQYVKEHRKKKNNQAEDKALQPDISLLSLWRITDSNRWPPACKAGALASWANPPKNKNEEVVPGRLELPTSTLSVWRSNQLSYRTVVLGVMLLPPVFLLILSL